MAPSRSPASSMRERNWTSFSDPPLAPLGRETEGVGHVRLGVGVDDDVLDAELPGEPEPLVGGVVEPERGPHPGVGCHTPRGGDPRQKRSVPRIPRPSNPWYERRLYLFLFYFYFISIYS